MPGNSKISYPVCQVRNRVAKNQVEMHWIRRSTDNRKHLGAEARPPITNRSMTHRALLRPILIIRTSPVCLRSG